MSQPSSESETAEGAAPAPPPAPLLDIDLLLKPITVEQPCGADLRYEGTYDQIREARRSDDASLPQGIWVSELKRANWREVERLCLDALTGKSKDLQIAAWMTEALIHQHGMVGARDGLLLIRALCEAFWDDLHPNIPPDGDFEFRLASLHWANERLPVLLRLLPMTQPEAGDDGIFSLDDWENTGRMEVLAQRDRGARDRAEAEGRPSRAKFLTTVTLTPRNYYRDLTLVTTECLSTLEELQALLDEKCGEDGPNLLTLRGTLSAIREQALEFFREKGGSFEDVQVTHNHATDNGAFEQEPAMPLPGFGQAIKSRDEAYRLLAMASDYLMKAEPHSPSPYLVRRAVAWGSMSLDELLQELVSSEQDLTQLYSLLGMSKMGGKMPKR
jgi:type VI secretion system protein ImpA